MIHWSTNRKICAAGAVILAVSFVVSLTPMYRAYCDDDHRWTCAKIRKSIEWDYAHAVEAGERGSMALLSRVLENGYDADEYTVTPASSTIPNDTESPEGTLILGLCKEGGAFLVHVNADGTISVTCDAEGHDVDYTEYLY